MESRSGSFNDGVKVEHFYTKRLYHGSDADLAIGDVVEPRGSFVNGKYSTEPELRVAYATGEPKEAKGYGKNVYRVAYQPDEMPTEIPDAPNFRVKSSKGFKVIDKEKL